MAEQIIVPKPRIEGVHRELPAAPPLPPPPAVSQQMAPPPVPWRRARATPTPVPTDEHVYQQQQSLQKFQNGHTTVNRLSPYRNRNSRLRLVSVHYSLVYTFMCLCVSAIYL